MHNVHHSDQTDNGGIKPAVWGWKTLAIHTSGTGVAGMAELG